MRASLQLLPQGEQALHHPRFLIAFATLTVLLCAAAPCSAWLYDAGIPQHLGAMLREGSSYVWAAAPFAVEQDSWATSFGAALSRAFGPIDAGFTVYLTSTWSGLPESAMATWTVIPATASLEYYYFQPRAPMLLQAGTAYSLVFTPNDAGFAGAISYSAKPGSYYGWGSGDYGQTWTRLLYPLCIRVDGYAVPEPGTWLALVAGTIGAALRRRGRS